MFQLTTVIMTSASAGQLVLAVHKYLINPPYQTFMTSPFFRRWWCQFST